MPRYWVPEGEVKQRAARVPASLKRGYREENAGRVLKSLAEWLAGYFATVEGRAMQEADLAPILRCGRAWRSELGTSANRFLLDPKTITNGVEMQRETPLTADDIGFLIDGPEEPLALHCAYRAQATTLAYGLAGYHERDQRADGDRERVSEDWDEPQDAVVLHELPPRPRCRLVGYVQLHGPRLRGQKQNRGHLSDLLLPEAIPGFGSRPIHPEDLAFTTPRVLELSYTSYTMRLWAEDLGHTGAPFNWNDKRRAELRADLDAFFARKYSLTRDELRYLLDPADARGADYPSETFRVLKEREMRELGEYRTQRLVLASFDRLARV
jgi:hypothetical protein